MQCAVGFDGPSPRRRRESKHEMARGGVGDACRAGVGLVDGGGGAGDGVFSRSKASLTLPMRALSSVARSVSCSSFSSSSLASALAVRLAGIYQRSPTLRPQRAVRAGLLTADALRQFGLTKAAP